MLVVVNRGTVGKSIANISRVAVTLGWRTSEDNSSAQRCRGLRRLLPPLAAVCLVLTRGGWPGCRLIAAAATAESELPVAARFFNYAATLPGPARPTNGEWRTMKLAPAAFRRLVPPAQPSGVSVVFV